MKNSSVAAIVIQKQALVFDLFHTLVRVDPTWGTYQELGVSREIWNEHLLEKSPKRLSGAETEPFIIVERLARAIDPSISRQTVERATETRIEKFAEALINIPDDTLEFFHRLSLLGKRIGLVSNADVMECAAWYDSPIASFFDSVIFSCRVGYAKPEPEIYRACLRELGVRSEDSIFIGDGGSGELQGARAIGMIPVLMTGIIKEAWPDRISSRSDEADFVIDNLWELIDSP